MAWPWHRLLDLLWQMFSCHFMKSNGLNSVLRNLNQFFTEDMLMTFLFSSNRLNSSRNFVIILLLVIQTFLFPLNKKNGKLSFLDVEVSREKGKFVTAVYKKPTFSGVYTHFESFLPTVYKFGMVYTIVYCCFKICSDWSKFHEELSFLKQVFLKYGYPLSFIDNCFKTFVDKLFTKRPQFATAVKETLFLSLPYLGEISLQTRTKLTKSFKGLLNSCKLQIVFKSQRKLSNVFRFKDRLPFDLVSGVVYKYTCGRCNSTYYGETDRHVKVRSGEHIGISPLTFKKTKPSKESAIRDHLLNCNNIASFEEFTILANGNNKFALEIKESLLIKRDRPILNKNINSAKLFLFDNS